MVAASRKGRTIFINCPFDAQYRPIFDAIVFTAAYSGFRVVCALSENDSMKVRVHKILDMTRACSLGIHDISRTETDPGSGLPRFNMPFELGLFFGMAYSAGNSPTKRGLILDKKRYQYHQFLSDLSGNDIAVHANKPIAAIKAIRDWLAPMDPARQLTGSDAIAKAFRRFEGHLSAHARGHGFAAPRDVTFVERLKLTLAWLDAQRRLGTPHPQRPRK